MMNGYDKEEALGYILPRIDRKAHRALGERIDALISQAIDADMAYMFESGVLDEEGNAGESYYDDDEDCPCWRDEFGRTQGVIAWCEPKFEQ